MRSRSMSSRRARIFSRSADRTHCFALLRRGVRNTAAGTSASAADRAKELETSSDAFHHCPRSGFVNRDTPSVAAAIQLVLISVPAESIARADEDLSGIPRFRPNADDTTASGSK